MFVFLFVRWHSLVAKFLNDLYTNEEEEEKTNNNKKNNKRKLFESGGGSAEDNNVNDKQIPPARCQIGGNQKQISINK